MDDNEPDLAGSAMSGAAAAATGLAVTAVAAPIVGPVGAAIAGGAAGNMVGDLIDHLVKPHHDLVGLAADPPGLGMAPFEPPTNAGLIVDPVEPGAIFSPVLGQGDGFEF